MLLSKDAIELSFPSEIKQQLDDYANEGKRPCDFLMYVLYNNLVRSLLLADKASFRSMGDIVTYINTELNPAIWGSEIDVHAWLQFKEEKGVHPLDTYKLQLGYNKRKQAMALHEALIVSTCAIEEFLKGGFNDVLDQIRQKGQFAINGDFENSLAIKIQKQ